MIKTEIEKFIFFTPHNMDKTKWQKLSITERKELSNRMSIKRYNNICKKIQSFIKDSKK